MSDIFDGLQRMEKEASSHLHEVSDWFSAFCSPVQVCLVLVLVQLVQIAAHIYQVWQISGKLEIAADQVRSSVLLGLLLAATMYLCKSNQPTYAWVLLALYAARMVIQATCTISKGVSALEDQLAQRLHPAHTPTPLADVVPDAGPAPIPTASGSPSHAGQSGHASHASHAGHSGQEQPYDPFYSHQFVSV